HHRSDDDEDPRAEGLRDQDTRRSRLRLPGRAPAPAGDRRHGSRVHRPRLRRRLAADAAAPGQADDAEREGAEGAAQGDRGGGRMTAANVLAWCAQIAVVVIACAGLPRLLGVRSPGVQYAFWRTVLAVCLARPLLQPWRAHEMVFVPAPAPPVGASAGPAPAMPAGPAQTAPVDWTGIAGAGNGIGTAAG